MTTKTIVVSYFGYIQKVAGKAKESLSVNEGTTVSELLSLLAKRNGDDFAFQIFDEQGFPRSNLTIVLDGKKTIDMSTRLLSTSEAQILTLAPVSAGG